MHSRAMVGSGEVFRSISPVASASAYKWVRILSQVPSRRYWGCRLQTVCQGPNSAGRSRHGSPTRSRKLVPSIT